MTGNGEEWLESVMDVWDPEDFGVFRPTYDPSKFQEFMYKGEGKYVYDWCWVMSGTILDFRGHDVVAIYQSFDGDVEAQICNRFAVLCHDCVRFFVSIPSAERRDVATRGLLEPLITISLSSDSIYLAYIKHVVYRSILGLHPTPGPSYYVSTALKF